MQLSRFLLTSIPLLAGHVLGQTTVTTNDIFFPPQNASSDILAVRAGDMLNITWSTSWDRVDLHVDASALGTPSVSPPPPFTAGLPGIGFLSYRLDPTSFQVSNASLSIAAVCRLVNSADQTQFVSSQNFTVEQLDANQTAAASSVPGSATWTGSVTLFASAGATITSIPPGATLGSIPNKRATADAAATTTAPLAAAQTTTSTPTATNTAAPPPPNPSGLSREAQIGIGVGVSFGVLLLGGLAGLAWFLRRRRSRQLDSENEKSIWPVRPYQPTRPDYVHKELPWYMPRLHREPHYGHQEPKWFVPRLHRQPDSGHKGPSWFTRRRRHHQSDHNGTDSPWYTRYLPHRQSGYARAASVRKPIRGASQARPANISRPEMIHRLVLDENTGIWGPAPPGARFAAGDKKRAKSKVFRWAVEEPRKDKRGMPKMPEPAAGLDMPSRAGTPLLEMYAGPLSARIMAELPAVISPRKPAIRRGVAR